MGRPKKTQSKGLGDTVEKITKATGIDKVAKFILGEDCKCDERKAKLNKIFPYRKPECLTEDEYNWLKESGIFTAKTFKPSEQKRINDIYSRIFKVRKEPTSCASCLKDTINQIEKVFNEYEK